jgi:hypothetical protein
MLWALESIKEVVFTIRVPRVQPAKPCASDCAVILWLVIFPTHDFPSRSVGADWRRCDRRGFAPAEGRQGSADLPRARGQQRCAHHVAADAGNITITLSRFAPASPDIHSTEEMWALFE